MTASTPQPSLRHRLEYRGFVLIRTLASLVPEPVAMGFADALGWVAGVLLRIRRKDVDAHLALAFPDWRAGRRARTARAAYRHLAREAVVLFRMGRWPRERILDRSEVRGLEQLRGALREHGGALLLTGHLGNWEVGGAALAARGVPMDVVAKGMANRGFEEALFGTRARLGMRVLEMQAAPREVLKSLRRGRVVAIVGDQNARRSGVFVPFFGVDAATARGAAVFALRTGVPVYVGFGVREPGLRARYTVDLLPLRHEVSGDPERDVEVFCAAYMRAVEEAVRAWPEQYFWHHKRWRTRPPQEQPAAPPVEIDTETKHPGLSGSAPSDSEGLAP